MRLIRRSDLSLRREKKRLKRILSDFPWLWAVRQRWSWNETTRTVKIFNATEVAWLHDYLITNRELEVWLHCEWSYWQNAEVVVQIKADEQKEQTWGERIRREDCNHINHLVIIEEPNTDHEKVYILREKERGEILRATFNGTR